MVTPPSVNAFYDFDFHPVLKVHYGIILRTKSVFVSGNRQLSFLTGDLY